MEKEKEALTLMMFCFALLSWLVSSTAIWSGGNASCHAGRPLEVYSTQIGEV